MNRERWALRSDLRILRNLRECYLDRLFKLRIASGNYVSRRDLDIEIRRYADILVPHVVPLGSYAARFGRRIEPPSMNVGTRPINNGRSVDGWANMVTDIRTTNVNARNMVCLEWESFHV